jgi:hypothetical protein
MNGRPQDSKNKVFHIWSPEEKEYLKQITPGHHYKEIQELMNKKINLEFTMDQIKGAIGRYKLNTGFTGQFNKGHAPANKGVKGVVHEGCKKTWFKKGNRPINHRSIGSERINVDGYIEIKVAEPNKWRLKHRVIWEENNGPISKYHNVIFGDGDKSNLDVDNLILVSKKQLLILNRNNLIQKDADLTRTGVIIADLYQKISEKKKVRESNE